MPLIQSMLNSILAKIMIMQVNVSDVHSCSLALEKNTRFVVCQCQFQLQVYFWSILTWRHAGTHLSSLTCLESKNYTLSPLAVFLKLWCLWFIIACCFNIIDYLWSELQKFWLFHYVNLDVCACVCVQVMLSVQMLNHCWRHTKGLGLLFLVVCNSSATFANSDWESFLFSVSGCFVYVFWIFKMSSWHFNSNVKYSLEIKVYWSLKVCTYSIVPLSLYQLKNCLRMTVLSFNAILSGTIYHSAKFVIVTGLAINPYQ